MDFEKLVIDFEGDIQRGYQDFITKVKRSIAGHKIVAMGQDALPLIVNRIEQHLSWDNEVCCGWAALICRIGVEQKVGNPPRDLPFGEVSAWVAWAKNVLNPQMRN